MATIITLHGTNDTQPSDEGEQWWQIGSGFDRALNKLIKGSQDAVEIVPFRWSGKNSESDRRAEGKRLLAWLRKEFESKQRPYHLLAHSHGGSVVREALVQATLRNRSLEHLRSWTTVGTPFLKFRQSRYLFSRLGLIGRVLFLFVIVYFIAAIFAMFSDRCKGNFSLFAPCWGTTIDLSQDQMIDILNQADRITNLSIWDIPDFQDWGEVTAELDDIRFEPVPISASAPSGSDGAAGPDADVLPLGPRATWTRNDTSETPFDRVLFENFEPDVIAHLIGEPDAPPVIIDLCQNDFLLDPAKAAEFDLKYCAAGLFSGAYVDDYLSFVPQSLDFMVWGRGDYTEENLLLAFRLALNQNFNSLQFEVSREYFETSSLAFDNRPFFASLYFFLLISGVTGVAYILARFLFVRRNRRNSRRVRAKLAETFGDRWISFSHQDDEVINAIAHARSVKTNIAPRNFLSGSVAAIVSLALLAGFFTTSWPSQAFAAVESAACETVIDGRPAYRDICYEYSNAIDTLRNGVGNPYAALESLYLSILGLASSGEPLSTNMTDIFRVLANLSILGLVVMTALIIGRILESVAVPTARRFLNGNIDGALRATAFGHDLTGEHPEAAGLVPHELEHRWHPLDNDRVGAALTRHVAGQVDALVARMRQLLGIADKNSHTFDVAPFYDAITWSELIHTSYFRVAEVQELIAAGLISTGDFDAGAEFANANEAQTWLANLRVSETVTPAVDLSADQAGESEEV
jgi:hypothetical protein